MIGGLIHVGAWDGSEYIGNSRRPLLLFEPDPRAFASLKANLGGDPDIYLWRCACGARHGILELHVSEPNDNGSLLAPAVPSFTHGGRTITFTGATEHVVVVPLDYAVAVPELFDELVIDTQGFELEVLKGAEATLHHVKRVSLEVHRQDIYPGAATFEDISLFLMQHGFKCAEHTIEDLEEAVFVKR